MTHVVLEGSADAKTKKTKQSKKTGPSMDDNAGKENEGGTAPGTTDSQSSQVEMVDQTPKKKKPGEAEPEPVTLEEEDAPPQSSEPEAPSPFPLNWLSLMIQQDFLVYGSTPDVCPSVDINGKEFKGQGDYSCRDSAGVYKGDVYHGAGNQVHGGFGLGTLRINLGYDRVLGSQWQLGARFGMLLLQAPGVTGSKAPKPIGGELRAAYYFGDSPFERQGIRPFASVAAGFAEVDGKVSVQVYKDHIAYEAKHPTNLDAWRTTGPFFGAVSGGASIPFGNFMLSGELRAQLMLGNFAFSPAVALTLSYGL
ncbi:MAG TPA: hypothetical protein VGR66_06445 [Candidatus Eisenbacteria bacterium]|jgi:hypothetical protein|nr:hypothetical protein [Candidatus Eisenbacteria bacterium]